MLGVQGLTGAMFFKVKSTSAEGYVTALADVRAAEVCT